MVVTHLVLAASGYINDMIDLSGVGWSATFPAQPAREAPNLVLVLLRDLLVVRGVSPLFVVVGGAWLHLITVTLGAPSRGWPLWLL